MHNGGARKGDRPTDALAPLVDTGALSRQGTIMRSPRYSTRGPALVTAWSRLAWRTGEMMLASAEVIAVRSSQVLAAGVNPDARDRAECVRMVSEKWEASLESGAGVGGGGDGPVDARCAARGGPMCGSCSARSRRWRPAQRRRRRARGSPARSPPGGADAQSLDARGGRTRKRGARPAASAHARERAAVAPAEAVGRRARRVHVHSSCPRTTSSTAW